MCRFASPPGRTNDRLSLAPGFTPAANLNRDARPVAMVVLDEIAASGAAPVASARAASAAPTLDPGRREDLGTGDAISDATRVEGNARYKRKDFKGAEELYTLALAQADPIGELIPAILGNRSAARLALGRLADALADAEEMASQCPDGHVMAGKARYRQGNVLAAMGRTEDARRAYHNAISLTPDEKAQKPILAKLMVVTKVAVVEHQKEQVQAELHKQRELMRETKQLNEFNTQAGGKPPKERYTMANRALRDGNNVRALKLYASVDPAKLDAGKAPQYWGNVALAHVRNKEYPEAVEAARRCIKEDPTYAKGRYRLGEALLKRARTAEHVLPNVRKEWVRGAIDEGFNEALRLNPDIDNEETKRLISDGEVLLQELNTITEKKDAATVAVEEREGTKDEEEETKEGSESGSADSADWVKVSEPKERGPKIVSFDAITSDDEDHPERIAFIEAMKEHGCVCVRLHEKLVAPVNVFVEAGASASAFFKLKGDMKAKHKPIGGYDPPAQSGYHTRTGFHHPRDTRAKSIRGASCLRKDEEDLECFVVENEYAADFPWPNVKFKERLLDAHITARMTASKCGDVLMTAADVNVMDPDFDRKAEKCGLKAMTCRTTFACHPKIDTNHGKSISGQADMQFMHSMNAGTAEPTLVSIIPRVDDPSRGRRHSQVYLEMPKRGGEGLEKLRWPPAGQEEELRDSVLVVAGEYVNQMTDGMYPAPRVCYTRRCDKSEDVVRATYRA